MNYFLSFYFLSKSAPKAVRESTMYTIEMIPFNQESLLTNYFHLEFNSNLLILAILPLIHGQ